MILRMDQDGGEGNDLIEIERITVHRHDGAIIERIAHWHDPKTGGACSWPVIRIKRGYYESV